MVRLSACGHAQAGTFGTIEKRSRRIAEQDRRDGRDEVGIQSVHVAPFSHVSRFTRHGHD